MSSLISRPQNRRPLSQRLNFLPQRARRVLPRLAASLAVSIALSATTLAAQAQAPAPAPEVTRAAELLKAGNAAEAYKLLAPLEDKLAGNAEYDYLFGVAALDSGNSDRATIAFERVLAVNPNFAGARLDLARAYFQLGDLNRAKTEFETVLTQDPPPAARATIATYLAAIEKAEQAKLRSIRVYAEATLGYDTNVNNSTSQSTVLVPALGGLPFTLGATNVQTADEFGAIGTGIEYTRQIIPGIAGFVGGDFRKRQNRDVDVFDNQSMDLRAGAAFGGPEHQLKLTGSAGRFDLDNQLSRKSTALAAEWRYAINPATQVNAFSQYARFRFTDVATQVNSFNATTSGIGLLRILRDGKAALFGTYLFGEERDTDGRADGPKKSQGIRLGGQLQLREDLDLFSLVGYTQSRYGRENAAFLATRRDNTTDLVVGLNWRFARDWTLKPQVLKSSNRSNIAIYPFERTEWSLTVRRDFSL